MERVAIWGTGTAVLLTLLLAAWRLRWLTPGGIVAAVIVGGVMLAGAGSGGLLLLLLFFVTASALTSWNPSRDGARPAGGDAAGRGASQVLANGGVAAGCALLALLGGFPAAHHALTGAMAAAAADTWATEVGTGVGGSTRRILTWEPVEPGRSGGLSWAGTLAGTAGALLLGGTAVLLPPGGGESGGVWLLAGLAGGLVGMTADSLLGASLEKRLKWVDNDAVNLSGTLAGAGAAALVGWLAGAGI